MPLDILVTGGSGFLGTRLLERLLDDPKVGRVAVLDMAPPALSHPRLAFVKHDISQPFPDPPFPVQAVGHLAFVLNPIKDLRRQSAVNLDGTRHLLDFCERQKVSALVAVSSGTAYGAHADNPAQLTEDNPLRAEPSFPYAHEKRLMEELIAVWADVHENVAVSVLRPCIVMGPEVDNYISRTIGKTLAPCIAGANPPMQFVHVTDVARALALLLVKHPRGAFNVAGDGPLPFYEAIQLGGNTPLPMPQFLASSLGEVLWQTGVLEGPPGMTPFLMHPWVMDCTRLKKELGFTFSYDSKAALRTWARARKAIKR